ncbi:MAG: hypothetical protein KY468_09545 [Armatimonadetes bacterium]|nr:hypothetical protein [Armatimonadota bacterium]
MPAFSVTKKARPRWAGIIPGIAAALLSLCGTLAPPASAQLPDLLWKTGSFKGEGPWPNIPPPPGQSFRVDYNGKVWIYDPQTGELLRTFQLPIDMPSLSAMSPDGAHLLVYSRIYNHFVVARTRDGQVVQGFQPASTRGYGAQFIPDTSLFLLTDAGYTGEPPVALKVWDPYEARLVWQKELPGLRPVQLTPGNRAVLVSGRDGAEVLSLRDGTTLLSLPPQRRTVFSPDGGVMAALSADGTLAFYRTGTWQPLTPAPAGPFSFFEFSPDGETFAALTGQVVKVYRAGDGTLLREIAVGEVGQFNYSPSGRHLVARKDDDTIRIFRVADGAHRLDLHRKGLQQIRFSPDEEHLMIAYNPSHAHNFPVAAEVLRIADGFVVWKHATENAYGLFASLPVFSPDGTSFSVTSQIGTSTHRLSDGRFLGFTGHGGTPAAFSADSRFLATRWRNSAALFDAASGKGLGHFLAPATVHDAALSPDGSLLAAGAGEPRYYSLWDMPFEHYGADPKAMIWSTATGKLVAELDHAAPVTAVAFSPDGATLATAAGKMSVGHEDSHPHTANRFWVSHRTVTDNRIRLWRAGDWTLIRAFEPDSEEVLRLAFSPDGATIAALMRSGSVRLTRVSDGKRLWTFTRDYDERLTPGQIQFSPDGAVVSASYSWFEVYPSMPSRWFHQIRRWRVADGEELPSLEGARLSPDESTIAMPEGFLESHSLILKDAATGQEVRTYTQGTEGVEALLFSPNGHLLAYREKHLALAVARNPIMSLEPGDVNRDGAVDVRDVVLTLAFVVKLEVLSAEQRHLADLLPDREITIQDVILILKKAVGAP